MTVTLWNPTVGNREILPPLSREFLKVVFEYGGFSAHLDNSSSWFSKSFQAGVSRINKLTKNLECNPSAFQSPTERSSLPSLVFESSESLTHLANFSSRPKEYRYQRPGDQDQ